MPKLLQLLVFLTLVAISLPSIAGMDQEISAGSDTITDYGQSGLEEPDPTTGKWLPVPIPLRNPTIGSGLVASLLYLHPLEKPGSGIPNATSGAAIMAANSGSWFAGLFHDGYYWKDKVRVRAAGGVGKFNLDFFGIGEKPIFEDKSIPYQIEGSTFQLQGLWQLGKSDFYIGIRETYLAAQINFDLGILVPGLPVISGTSVTSSLSALLENDRRDDNYYPTRGHYFKASFSKDDDKWGSDYSFERLSLAYTHYWNLGDSMVLAGRVLVSELSGDAPFYLLPTLDIRGFPRGRYRGDAVFSTHVEFRHKFSSRWGYVIFGEFGSTSGSVVDAIKNDQIKSAGAGIRWQVLSSKTLNLGIDYGVSGSDSAVYIKVGESF